MFKTAFNVVFAHYEWYALPFEFKNAAPDFQNVMNDILNQHSKFTIAYIDDTLIFSNSTDQHSKHLDIF